MLEIPFLNNVANHHTGNRGRRSVIVQMPNARFGVDYALNIASLPKKERDEAVVGLKEVGLTIRQIQRLTGIGFGIIAKAKR